MAVGTVPGGALMRVQLTCIDGNGSQKAEKLFDLGHTNPRIRIGRQAGVDFWIDDEKRSVSNIHCELHWRAGQLWLSDTSTNGVALKGLQEAEYAPIQKGELQPVLHGSRILLPIKVKSTTKSKEGHYYITVSVQGSAEPPPVVRTAVLEEKPARPTALRQKDARAVALGNKASAPPPRIVARQPLEADARQPLDTQMPAPPIGQVAGPLRATANLQQPADVAPLAATAKADAPRAPMAAMAFAPKAAAPPEAPSRRVELPMPRGGLPMPRPELPRPSTGQAIDRSAAMGQIVPTMARHGVRPKRPGVQPDRRPSSAGPTSQAPASDGIPVPPWRVNQTAPPQPQQQAERPRDWSRSRSPAGDPYMELTALDMIGAQPVRDDWGDGIWASAAHDDKPSSPPPANSNGSEQKDVAAEDDPEADWGEDDGQDGGHDQAGWAAADESSYNGKHWNSWDDPAADVSMDGDQAASGGHLAPPLRPSIVARPPAPRYDHTEESAQAPSMEEKMNNMSVDECKQEIWRLYQRFRPEQLSEWERLVEKYRGGEFAWLQALKDKYLFGEEPAPIQVAPEEAPRRAKAKLPMPPPSSRQQNRAQQQSPQQSTFNPPPPPPSNSRWKRPWMQH